MGRVVRRAVLAGVGLLAFGLIGCGSCKNPFRLLIPEAHVAAPPREPSCRAQCHRHPVRYAGQVYDWQPWLGSAFPPTAAGREQAEAEAREHDRAEHGGRPTATVDCVGAR